MPPLFNEPSSSDGDAASHTPPERARAQDTDAGPTPMRTVDNTLANGLRLQASLADTTPPRRQDSGSPLLTPPRRLRIIIQDDSTDDIFTDEVKLCLDYTSLTKVGLGGRCSGGVRLLSPSLKHNVRRDNQSR